MSTPAPWSVWARMWTRRSLGARVVCEPHAAACHVCFLCRGGNPENLRLEAIARLGHPRRVRVTRRGAGMAHPSGAGRPVRRGGGARGADGRDGHRPAARSSRGGRRRAGRGSRAGRACWRRSPPAHRRQRTSWSRDGPMARAWRQLDGWASPRRRRPGGRLPAAANRWTWRGPGAGGDRHPGRRRGGIRWGASARADRGGRLVRAAHRSMSAGTSPRPGTPTWRSP